MSTNVYTTRFGRTVKKPERFEPVEVCDDDFKDSDYDETESDVSSEVSFESDELTSESDADDNGNLTGFIRDENNDDSDVDGDSCDSGSETSDGDSGLESAGPPTETRGPTPP